MSKVLVLGGAGFIGHHVVRELLKKGYEVRVLVKPTSDTSLLKDLQVEMISGDFEEKGKLAEALEGCEYLIHSAGHYPVYSLQPAEDVRRGLNQIARIHHVLSKVKVKRFLFVSSLTAIGKYPDGRPEDENAPYPVQRDRSAYCRAKRAMQQMVLARAQSFNTVVVAPTAVLGEGDLKASTGRLLVDVAKKNVKAAVSGKTNAVDVHDVAKGIVLALEKGQTGRVYVLGGENMTTPELIRRIAKQAGVPEPRTVIYPWLLIPIAWLSEVLGRTFRQKKPILPQVGLHFSLFGEELSSAIAERELDYTTGPVDAAIKRGLKWYRDNGFL